MQKKEKALELNPCPFCKGEVELEPDRDAAAYWVNCPKCGASGPICQTAKEAVEKWEHRAEPPNAPLTLDELRQMDGEPVWIHAPEIPQRQGWAIVEGFDDEAMYIAYAELTLDGYGKYWWAYRHKPEVVK